MITCRTKKGEEFQALARVRCFYCERGICQVFSIVRLYPSSYYSTLHDAPGATLFVPTMSSLATTTTTTTATTTTSGSQDSNSGGNVHDAPPHVQQLEFCFPPTASGSEVTATSSTAVISKAPYHVSESLMDSLGIPLRDVAFLPAAATRLATIFLVCRHQKRGRKVPIH